MVMTDEEIEFALKQYAAGGGRNVQNMDWAGTIDYINRLKASCESAVECTIEQHGEIHRLRDELRQARAENEDMHGKLMSLQAYIDNHEEIWKHNAEIDKAIVRKDTAKEILRHFPHNRAREFFCKKYGVEVDDE